MSALSLSNGATIIVDGTNKQYHTKDDWDLVITNTDCIGEPIQQTTYVNIPGGQQVDLSEVLMGRPVFIKREIKIVLSGIRERYTGWDSVISTIRNSIHGRKCKVIFDNDKSYYYYGRIEVKDFSSLMSLGTLTIDIPDADPYKYNIADSTEKWLWDSFSFEEGTTERYNNVVVSPSTTKTIIIPKGRMEVSPTIITTFGSGTPSTAKVSLTYKKNKYSIPAGEFYDPRIKINGDEEVELKFTTSYLAILKIIYRGGSL